MGSADPDIDRMQGWAEARTRLLGRLGELPPDQAGQTSRSVEHGIRKLLKTLVPQDPQFHARNHAVRDFKALSRRIRDCAATLSSRDPGGWQYLSSLQSEALAAEIRLGEISARREEWFREALKPGIRKLAMAIREDALARDETEKRMDDLLGFSPGLWDLKPGSLTRIPWKDLESTAAWLSGFPQLAELARRLGQRRPDTGKAQSASPAGDTRKTGDGISPSRTEGEPDFGELAGFTQGRDISRLTGPDFARLLSPGLEEQFLIQHAEGRLFIKEYREYRTPSPRNVKPQAVDESPPSVSLLEGPVIVCLDTSGSMEGIPEQTAKALTLALARTCHSSGRPLYLIMFSDRVECRKISGNKGETDLEGLIGFLGFSFRGGTDLRPALEKSLQVLGEAGWEDADLLIISDFRVPKILIKRSAQIQAIRRDTRARIHALSITPSRMSDDLHLFDSAWHFAIGARGEAQGFLPGAFREVLG